MILYEIVVRDIFIGSQEACGTRNCRNLCLMKSIVASQAAIERSLTSTYM